MNNEQKEALIRGIKRIFDIHADTNSIEAYCRCYFVRWYDRCIINGVNPSIEEFWEQIPESCRVPEATRRAEFEKLHEPFFKALKLFETEETSKDLGNNSNETADQKTEIYGTTETGVLTQSPITFAVKKKKHR